MRTTSSCAVFTSYIRVLYKCNPFWLSLFTFSGQLEMIKTDDDSKSMMMMKTAMIMEFILEEKLTKIGVCVVPAFVIILVHV
jgi:hypothetical protein